MSDSTRTVHIVDDDEAIRQSIGFLLRKDGYEVRTHASGTAFLKEATGRRLRPHELRGHGGADRSRPLRRGYSATLREMIARVIAAEAPIRDDILVERIARAHGFRRSGRVIRDRVMTLARAASHVAQEDRGPTFVWPDLASVAAWDRPRYPAISGDVRDLGDIALPGLTAVLRVCVEDDRVTEAARALGVRRLSAAGRDRLQQAEPKKGHLA